jgi:hypothetical protein
MLNKIAAIIESNLPLATTLAEAWIIEAGADGLWSRVPPFVIQPCRRIESSAQSVVVLRRDLSEIEGLPEWKGSVPMHHDATRRPRPPRLSRA